MDSVCKGQASRIRPGRTGALGLAVLGAALALAGPVTAQVGLLPNPDEVAKDALGALRWQPLVELRLGESMSLLGTEVWLSLVPGMVIDAGANMPGGARAPFRLETELAGSVLSGAGRRPLALTIPGPGPGAAAEDELPLLGPGLSMLLWNPAGSGSDWAYARVLEVTGLSATFEFAEVPGSIKGLERDPVGLQFSELSELSWTSFRGGLGEPPPYVLERRAIGEAQWSPLAEGIPRGEDGVYRWVDASAVAAPPRVFEYRAFDPAAAEAVGAYVRAHGFGEPVVGLGPNTRLNLISGQPADPGEDAHVEVGRAASGVLVLTPQEGVRFSRIGSAKKSSRGAGAALTAPSRPWRIADPTDPGWLPSKSVALRDGDEVDFLLPSGLRGRLSVEEMDALSWAAQRRLCLDGSGLLPRTPRAPLGTKVLPASDDVAAGIELELPLPTAAVGASPSDVVFEVERELPLGSQRWETVARSAPGAASVTVAAAFEDDEHESGRSSRPVARLRLRAGVAFGSRSGPGDSMDVLAAGDDEGELEAALQWALIRIAQEDFLRRMEARAVIRALGDRARPALLSLSQTDRGRPRGLAAAEALRQLDQSGGGSRFRLALRRGALEALRSYRRGDDEGALDEWLGALPAGLDATTVNERAHGLLLAIDRAERGVASPGGSGTVGDDVARASAWLEAAAFVESDEGLRWLARFLLEIGLKPSLASFESEAPAWLLTDGDRLADEPLDFAWGGQPATAEELRWFLESRPELAHFDLGPPLARLHVALESLGAPGWAPEPASVLAPYSPSSGADEPRSAGLGADAALFDYDARTAELVLRLLERVRRSWSGLGSGPDDGGAAAALVAAAEALLPGTRLTLRAARSVSDRRLASPSPNAPDGRRVLRLEGGDLTRLQAELLELRGALDPGVDAGVDIVLGGGDWSWGRPPGGALVDKSGVSKPRPGRPSFIELRRGNVRILGEEEGAPPRLLTGLRVTGRNVVLQGLVVENATGQALTVIDEGHVVALGCDLRGASSVIHLQKGDAELFECRVLPASSGTTSATAARLILASRLTARATLFAAGSLFISSDASIELDRCVVDSGERMLVQAQERGQLFARESLLRGTGSGLFRVNAGYLVGSVIDVARDPLGRLPQSQQVGGLRISPSLFRLVAPGQEVPPLLKMPVEPLLPAAPQPR